MVDVEVEVGALGHARGFDNGALQLEHGDLVAVKGIALRLLGVLELVEHRGRHGGARSVGRRDKRRCGCVVLFVVLCGCGGFVFEVTFG